LCEIATCAAAHRLRGHGAECVEQVALLERQKREIDVAIVELRQIYMSFYKALLEDPHSG
jgi:hypothetical protein